MDLLTLKWRHHEAVNVKDPHSFSVVYHYFVIFSTFQPQFDVLTDTTALKTLCHAIL